MKLIVIALVVLALSAPAGGAVEAEPAKGGKQENRKGAVKKQKKFKLAETLEGADFVLVAFAKYPFAQLTMQGRQVISAWRSYEGGGRTGRGAP